MQKSSWDKNLVFSFTGMRWGLYASWQTEGHHWVTSKPLGHQRYGSLLAPLAQAHWVCASREVSSPWTKSTPQPPDPFVTPVCWKTLSVDVGVDQDNINILLGLYFLRKTHQNQPLPDHGNELMAKKTNCKDGLSLLLTLLPTRHNPESPGTTILLRNCLDQALWTRTRGLCVCLECLDC